MYFEGHRRWVPLIVFLEVFKKRERRVNNYFIQQLQQGTSLILLTLLPCALLNNTLTSRFT